MTECPESLRTRGAVVLQRSAKAVGVLAGAIALFSTLMLASYALPSGRIEANVAESVPLLKAEKSGYTPMLPHPAYGVDTFTDAIMLDPALVNGHGVVEAAFGTYHGSVDADPEWIDPIGALELSVAGNRYKEVSYSRYWNGYIVFLRPALIFLNYGQIRYLNVVLLGLLAVGLAGVLRKKVTAFAAGAFFVALLLAGFYIVPFSIQLSNMPYLMLLSCLAVLALADKPWFPRVDKELFLIIGAFTSFMDLLTAPILTLGMPMVLLLMIRARDDRTPRSSMFAAVSWATAWSFGYLGAWIAKWLLASIVLGTDVMSTALGQLAFRTGAGSGGTQVAGALLKNLATLVPFVDGSSVAESVARGDLPTPVLALFVVTVALACIILSFRRSRLEIRKSLPLLFPAALPYLWFVVASNHSDIHFWMTFRIQAVSILAVLALIHAVFDERRPLAVLKSLGSRSASGTASDRMTHRQGEG